MDNDIKDATYVDAQADCDCIESNADAERVDAVARQILQAHINAFRELAK